MPHRRELRRRKFSVIISDQLMPEITGLELLAQARSIQPFATRVLATAVLNLDTVIAAINKGEIFRFIIKPWLHEEFIATVKNASQRYQLICQNAHLQAATQSMNAQLVDLNRSLEQQLQLTSPSRTRSSANSTPPSRPISSAPSNSASTPCRRFIRPSARRPAASTSARPGHGPDRQTSAG